MGDGGLDYMWMSGLTNYAHEVERLNGESETQVDRIRFVANSARAEVIALFDRWGSFTPSSISEWDAADYPTETYALRYMRDTTGPLVAACAISHRKTVRRGGRNGNKEEDQVLLPLFVTHRAWRRLHLGQYLVQLILEVFYKRRIESVLVPSVQGALYFWRSSMINATEVPNGSSNESLHALSYKSCTLLRLPTRLRKKADYDSLPDSKSLAERVVVGSLLDGVRYDSMFAFKIAMKEARSQDIRFRFPSSQGILFDAVQRKDPAEALEVVAALLQTNQIDINEKDHIGQTPIFYCCNFDDRVDLVKALIQAHADAHIIDNNGQTCLFYAVKGGNRHMLTALVDIGVAVDNFDNTGHRPLFYALSGGHYSLVPILTRNKEGLKVGEFTLTQTERGMLQQYLNNNFTARFGTVCEESERVQLTA
eukprot:GEMP01019395.1.p1 GENE.GEMP01019395.1~~GEMP01019395.1.p1  ORF type:complete len:432 (+),score=48.97 GEMP01019395.1:27-1298(+)